MEWSNKGLLEMNGKMPVEKDLVLFAVFRVVK